jgi:alkylation response protein AidB-like acyl-CoA dehydrogenase
MDLEFTDDQQALRASVRSVLERHCPISLVRDVVEKGAPVGPLWEQMVALDWQALTVPADAGGLGLGYVELAVVLEELGRVVAPGPLTATVTQLVPAVREAGSAEQHRRFLGPVAEGRLTGTLALAEAGGRWAAGDVATVARARDGAWSLSGVKRWVVDGATADEMVVAARLEGTTGDDGIGLFVVPRDAVRAQPVASLDGSRQHATVWLEETMVGADRVLGRPGSAGVGRALRRAVEEATAAVAIETMGTCQSIFDIALEYAKVRRQFGVPIGSFQAMKHKFADMYVALERARALCYFAAVAIAEEDERRSLAVAMAKAAAGECQRLVAQEGVQALGGIGFTWEHDMHLYVKRAKAGDAVFGTAREQRARVAELVGLGPPHPTPA